HRAPEDGIELAHVGIVGPSYERLHEIGIHARLEASVAPGAYEPRRGGAGPRRLKEQAAEQERDVLAAHVEEGHLDAQREAGEQIVLERRQGTVGRGHEEEVRLPCRRVAEALVFPTGVEHPQQVGLELGGSSASSSRKSVPPCACPISPGRSAIPWFG